jgi:hypothetical protein
MRILFLTTVLPRGRSGGEVVSQAFIDGLRAAGHHVAVIGWARPGDAGAAEGEQLAGRRPIETSEAPLPVRAGWLLRALATRRPFSVAKYDGDGYLRRAAAALEHAELVVLDHSQAGLVTRRLGGGAPRVLIAHNVENQVYAEQAAAEGRASWLWRREARLMAVEERRLAAEAAAVWTLTERDAAAFAQMGAERVVSFDAPSAVSVRPPHSAPGGGYVALLGNWTWEPNARGLRWFLGEVVPLLPADFPIEVAGAGADWLERDPRVTYRGRVVDAAAFLAASRVVAVPSIAGGGVQVKTLDAIASGAWVVAGSEALRGIDEPPPTVFEARDAASFAAALTGIAASDQPAPAGEAIAWSAGRAARFAAEVAAEAGRVAPITAPANATG